MTDRLKEVRELNERLNHPLRRKLKSFASRLLLIILYSLYFAVYKLFELVFAAVVTVLLFCPVLLILSFRRVFKGVRIFETEYIYGRKALKLKINYFRRINFI